MVVPRPHYAKGTHAHEAYTALPSVESISRRLKGGTKMSFTIFEQVTLILMLVQILVGLVQIPRA